MTTPLRRDLPPLPPRIARLPVSDRGYPVPWFVAWVDGKPEFRAMDAAKMIRAVKEKRCWVCGDLLGSKMCFVIGPMCAVNRISAEPPSHRECAEFSAVACPFLSRPHMVRREGGLPEGTTEGAGTMIARNPGVMLLWMTRFYGVIPTDEGWLFQIGTPFEVVPYTQGRVATKDELRHAIDTGYPTLRGIAEQEGPEAVAALTEQRVAAERVLGVA